MEDRRYAIHISKNWLRGISYTVHVYMQPQITAIGLFLPRIFYSFLSNYNGYFVLNYNQHTVINRYPHIKNIKNCFEFARGEGGGI